MYMSALSASLSAQHNRASDSITESCEPPCGCWELNSEPLQEQPVKALVPSLPLAASHLNMDDGSLGLIHILAFRL